jgi:hypothetical protein
MLNQRTEPSKVLPITVSLTALYLLVICILTLVERDTK